jgi:leader peptidase (prepilin peptidase)/N-methyltransferase
MVFDDVLAVALTPWGLLVLGLVIGSFLNVVIHRLPLISEADWKVDARDILGLPEEPQKPEDVLTLSSPASRCPKCGHQIRWYENIPLISWLVLRGKCSACKTPIPVRYPLVELTCGLLFMACGHKFGSEPTVLLWCGFCALLLAASMIDWDTTYLHDDLTGPFLWVALIAATLGWIPVTLPTAIWGAVAGYLSLWSVNFVFRKVRGVDGMGNGDFKLLAGLCAWLGWPMLLPIILASSIVGAVVGIGLKLTSGLREGGYVPFGPFLAAAGVAVMFIGSPAIIDWFGWNL